MRTGATLLTAVLFTGGALAAPALAAPPHEPVPEQKPFTIPKLCGIEEGVTVTTVMLRAKRNTKTGRFTGAFKYQVTNNRTGRSVVVNNSGPGPITETVDEAAGTVTIDFDFKGRTVVFAFSEKEQAIFAAAGLPDIFATSGPIRYRVVLDISEADADADTPPTAISINFDTPNRVQDVCALIT